ncbi:hypothetical protein [Brachybacterium kimchii]|uniref:Uncharacterized protein n=1 Tax=Brachybacterium kimchii TaxID=2942909 RepID=A0ABY4N2Y2_9MICO|nr:hypothetical protein [Brachybacterium kimchii]UQN28907.1 hypothetical protein M4486_14925 [Brachybacterium kimchii]
MRRILCLCAASSLLALGLVACGSDSEEDPPTTAEATTEQSGDDDSPSEETTESASDDTDSEDADSGDSETPAPDDDPSDDPSDTPSDDPSESQDDASDEPSDSKDGDDSSGSTTGASTSIDTLWIDDTWTIEDVDEDLCEMGGKSRSPYAQDDDMFVCGPTAAGALACDMAEGETVAMCITSAVDHTAIRFDSPTAADGDMDQGDGDLIPLFVQLDDGSENGIQCSTISHDHDEHWHDKLSWYRCDDGSELLTDELIEETFDRGDDGSSWTAQRSVDKGKPETVPVMDAVFAGND